jgi:YggT family protein
VQLFFALVYLLLMLFQLALIIRIVFESVQIFARDWRPRGAALLLASGVYALTDPPIRALRRKVPPIRVGSVALDSAFLIVFLAVVVLMAVVQGLA